MITVLLRHSSKESAAITLSKGEGQCEANKKAFCLGSLSSLNDKMNWMVRTPATGRNIGKSSRILFFIHALLIVLNSSAFAGVEKFNARLTDFENISTLTVQDDKFPLIYSYNYVANPAGIDFLDKQVKGRIYLGIDHYNPVYIAEDFDLTLTFDVTLRDNFGYIDVIEDVSLSVEYQPGLTSGKYLDLDVYLIDKAYRITVDLVSVTGTIGANSITDFDEIPANVFLELEIETERYYYFNLIAPALNTPSASNNELFLSWSALKGAEEYDLEWTYVDNYAPVGGYAIAANALHYSFLQNATRVTVSDNCYKVPLTHDRGYLVYRVRGVGRHTDKIENIDFKLPGNWTTGASGSPLPANNYYLIPEHDSVKNWQYTSTFAENGKKKEVISYFDGSGRNRQAVTKLNTQNQAVVGESIYDHEGRAAIQALPVPAGSAVIRYYEKFNQNDSSLVYSKYNFDTDAYGCSGTPDSFSYASGAGKYYSHTAKDDHHLYVPDAEGYPFTHTKFAPDNTGRIRSQSGVGPTLMTGNGHETKYYYGQPSQRQIDNLFGPEAGYKSHYKKNLVIDPNGQSTVSYLDMKGNVVATALVGEIPDNLDSISLKASSEIRNVEDDLFAGEPGGQGSSNSVSFRDGSIEFATQFLVVMQQNYTFSYHVNLTSFDPCTLDNWCYNCHYDLLVSIVNECGEEQIPGGPVVTSPGSNEIEDSCDFAAEADYDLLDSLSGITIENMPVGVYTIYKTIRVNEATREEYAQHYLDTSLCIDTPLAFVPDTIDCHIIVSCDSCYIDAYAIADSAERNDALEHCNDLCSILSPCKAAYHMMLSDMMPGGQYALYAEDEEGNLSATELTSVLKDVFNHLPGDTSDWRHPVYTDFEDAARHNSKYYYNEDGSKSIIYVHDTSFGSKQYIPPVDDTLHVMFDADSLQYIYPQHLKNVEDFISYFQVSWTKSLVKYHPEYCYYNWCKDLDIVEVNNLTSDEFDYRLQLSRVLGSDIVYGEGDTVLWSTAAVCSTTVVNSDPYFAESGGYLANFNFLGGAYDQEGLFLDDLYVDFVSKDGTVFNLWTLISLNLFPECNNQYYFGVPSASASITCLQGKLGSPLPADIGALLIHDSLSVSQRERVWQLFVTYYISRKHHYQNFMGLLRVVFGSCNRFAGCVDMERKEILSKMLRPMWANLPALPFFDIINQPCNFLAFTNFMKKTKRFPDINTITRETSDGNGNGDNDQVDYDVYAATGRCPLANDLQLLLNTLWMAKNSSGDDSLTRDDWKNLETTLALTPDLYTAIINGGSDTTLDWRVNQDSLPHKLIVEIMANEEVPSWESTPDDPLCEITLEFPPGSDYNFDSTFLRFENLRYINSPNDYSFIVSGLAPHPNPPDIYEPLIDVPILGRISCVDIGTCTFPPKCEATENLQYLNLLFIQLIAAGELNPGTDSVDLVSGNYLTVLERSLLDYLGSGDWHWFYEQVINATPDTFAIFTVRDVSQVNPIQIKIEFQIDDILSAIPGFNFNSGNLLLDNFRANPAASNSNAFLFDIIWDANPYIPPNNLELKNWQGTVNIINDTTVFVAGSCRERIASICDQPQVHNRGDLEVFLGELADSFALADSGLTESLSQVKSFTTRLQSSIAGLTNQALTNYIDPDGSYIELYLSGEDTFEQVHTPCTILLKISDQDSAFVNFENWEIASLFNLKVNYEAGSGHFFIEAVLDSSGTERNIFLEGYSCYDIEECEVCTDFNNSVYSNTGNYWFFGEGAGINFNGGIPHALSGSPIATAEGCAAISDQNGNLLFYTDGVTVWDENHEVMLDTAGNLVDYLKGDFTSTQSAIIVPDPYDPLKRYYIFTVDYGGYSSSPSRGLNYALVAYNDTIGRFEVADTGNLFTPSILFTEKLTVIPHADGISFWIIANEWSGIFRVYKLDDSGNPPVLDGTYSTGLSYSGDPDFNTIGYMKANHAGNQLALISAKINYIYLFDFDNTTGAITLNASLSSPTDSPCSPAGGYGIEFSPDGSKLYVTMLHYGSCPGSSISPISYLVQYDLDDPFYASTIIYQKPFDLQVLYNVDDVIDTASDPYTYDFLGALSLGPDGKIYVARSGQKFLSAVAEPDKPGLSCRFEHYAVQLTGTCIFGLPNSLPIPGCRPLLPRIPLFPPDTVYNPCVEHLTALAAFNSQNHLAEYLAEKKRVFKKNYTDKCLEAIEEFKVAYVDREQHYTLYYYDQAGNRIKTVPPKGVNKLADPFNPSTQQAQINSALNQVVQDRQNKTSASVMQHDMPTRYEYNSLNKPIRMSMPDHQLMDNFAASSGNNGLPDTLTVHDIEIASNGSGFLVAEDGSGNGQIYLTSDGGQTWSPLTDNGQDDLHAVYMVSNTLAYTAGKNGTLLKYDGTDWNPINTGRSDHFNDVYFNGNGDGVLVGNNGLITYTTDDGQIWTDVAGVSGNIASFDFTDIDTGLGVVNNIGLGKIYKVASNGSQWTQINKIKAHSLNDIYFSTAGAGYAAGDDGLLLKTINAGSTWDVVATGITEDLKEIHANENNADLLVALTVTGEVLFSKDGGKSWTPWQAATCTACTVWNFVDMYFLSNDHGYIATDDGKLIRTLDAGLSWTEHWDPTGTDGGFSTVVSNSNIVNSVSMFNTSWGVMTHDDGYIQFWINNTGAITGSGSLLMQIMPSATGLISYFHNDGFGNYCIVDNQNKLQFSAGHSGFNALGALPASYSVPAIHFQTNKRGYAIIRTGSVNKLYLTTTSGAAWNHLPAALPGGAAALVTDINSVQNAAGKVIIYVACSNGDIYKAVDDPALLQTLQWVNISDIVPGELRSITYDQSDNTVAYTAGVDGRVYRSANGGTSWQMTPTGFRHQVKDMCIFNSASNKGLWVGSNGLSATLDNGTWQLRTPVSGVDFNSVAVYSNGVSFYATGDNGAHYFLSGNTPTNNVDLALATAQNINAIDIPEGVSSPPRAIFVGDKGLIYEQDFSTPPPAVLMADNPPLFYGTEMVTSSLWFAVGEDGFIWMTNNAGVTWTTQTVNPSISDRLNAVSFFDAQSGIAVGEDSTVLQYDASVQEWNQVSHTMPAVGFNDVHYYEPGKAVLVGDANSSVETIYKTTNGGDTWTDIKPGTSLTSQNLNAVYFIGSTGYVAGDDGVILKTSNDGANWVSQSSGTHANLNDVYFEDINTGWAVGDSSKVIKTMDAGATWTPWNLTGFAGNNDNFNAIAFSNSGQGVVAGSHGNDAPPVLRFTDQEDRYSVLYWYDEFGREVASQNTKQKNNSGNEKFSYTKYDALGRPMETGEAEVASAAFQMEDFSPQGILKQFWFNVLMESCTLREVTQTFYDVPFAPALNVPGFQQQRLRNRVTAMTYEDTYDTSHAAYDNAMFFSYDVHGNVKTLVRDITALDGLADAAGNPQRYKRMDYDYDLISGNVKEVAYQHEKPDEFYHRYEYDADNRITNLRTSKDGVIWDQDAKYFYYDQGPLARAELGDLKVQGIDYAYTIQGWLKGINSNTLDPTRDMGKDANIETVSIARPLHQFVGQDEFGFSLGYFNPYDDGTNTLTVDYKPIGSISSAEQFVADLLYDNDPSTPSNFLTDSKSLYNGNINHTITNIGHFKRNGQNPNAALYEYDQLNRLMKANTHSDDDLTANNFWASAATSTTDYRVDITYDPNGNIKTLNRKAFTGDSEDTSHNNDMDAFTYEYEHAEDDVSFGRNTNKLRAVLDSGDNSDYYGFGDIKTGQVWNTGNHSLDNYLYDEIGNLIQDKQEDIESIEWTVSGKVKKITRESGNDDPDLEFVYDAAGNRIVKIVKPRTGGSAGSTSLWEYTYYIRDASGNVLSTYEKKENEGEDELSLMENMLYGSSRVGIFNRDKLIASTASVSPDTLWLSSRIKGNKQYELSNHLGNVLTTVSDARKPIDENVNGEIDYYEASVSTAQDYYPFGMIRPNSFNFSGTAYRFGFQGHEKDDEVKGGGNSLAFTYRMDDVRLGRFWSNDPLSFKYPELSPFAFSGNQVIHTTELEGAEPLDYLGIGDDRGFIKSSTKDEYRLSPLRAGLKDASYIGLTLLGVNTVDNIVADWGDPNLSNGEKIIRTGEVVLNPTIKGTQVRANAAQGAKFEQQVKAQKQQTQNNVVQQITIKSNPSGVKTKLDIVGRDKISGQIKLTEAKSSPDAPLTPNQTKAFPEIQESGGTVVGKGKPPFIGGTEIPPTKVDIVRP